MRHKNHSLRFPIITQASELLVQGYLMRRNILAYKAPPNHKGYDLICVHPDPEQATNAVRIQVKSRYATDCERFVPLATSSLNSFDFLVAAFLNVGHFGMNNGTSRCKATAPEFYVFPRSYVMEHHRMGGSWEWLPIDGELSQYKDDNGFELIANGLKISPPSRPAQPRRNRTRRPRTSEQEWNSEEMEVEIEEYLRTPQGVR